MRNLDIEEQLQRAAANATPNVWEGVLSRCVEQEGKITVMEENTKKNKKIPWMAMAGVAAALVIGLSGFGYYTQYQAVDSIVSFDVNPSFELQVSRQEKILSVNALNEDAVQILDDMDLRGSSLKVAVNALVGSMMRNGYIDELKNSILVTVENNDAAKSSELQQQIVDEIDHILSANNITGSILSQSLEEDVKASDLKMLAETYSISTGKAALIQEIMANNPNFELDDLASRSIYELNLIAETKNMNLDNVNTTGNASEKAYIGEEAALEAALTHAGVDGNTITLQRVKLDWDDGVVEYEVEFYSPSEEFEYNIDALTGAILSYEREALEADDFPIYNTTQNTVPTTQTPASTPDTQSSTEPSNTQNTTDSQENTNVPAPSTTQPAPQESVAPPPSEAPATTSTQNTTGTDTNDTSAYYEGCPVYPDSCWNYPNCSHQQSREGRGRHHSESHHSNHY